MAKATAMILNYYDESAARITQLLEELDVEVVCWEKKGVNWFKNYGIYRPKLLFVDLLVPERDGVYCINKLVKQDPKAICILTHPYTSRMALSIEEKAFMAGAAAIIQKPIEKSHFNVVVGRFLHMMKK